MKRRNFLRGGAVGAFATGAATFGILHYPRRALAGWGEWPEDKLEALIPPERQAQNVLELYLYGGVTAFDTFYTVPKWGQGNQTFLNTFLADTEARFQGCGFAGELTEPFADDQNGVEVHLGPWTTPLRERPDIIDRLRVIVQRHDSLPHEGANPFALTGSRLGSPRLAGVGASIQRHFLERPGGLRSTPYAYVLYPGVDFPTDNVKAASAVGLHPGSARPLSVIVDSNSELSNLLSRNSVGDRRAEFDAAVDHYMRDYESRFRPGGKGAATRSAGRSNYGFSHFARRSAQELQDVLASEFFQNIDGQECTVQDLDMPAMQARLAASLLTRKDDRARYVQWIDGGLRPHPAAGHDTHQEHVNYASANVSHTLRQLAAIINKPGEDDPNKIDLATTMIIINTEFGRTPYVQGDDGLNHWPQGMVNVIIGGPISKAERGIYGAIGEDQGISEVWVSPAENRMMVMMALGIYPFSSQTFAVGDVGGGVKNELEAALRLKEIYLGIKA
ncbi:MAG TPA: DUF1501 domain-containing protein [Nannocystis exedens]|nr:DUF1501 domain-containing protein [Nannocystis exedens]